MKLQMKAKGELRITEEEQRRLESKGYTLTKLFEEKRPFLMAQLQLTESSPCHIGWVALDEGYSVGTRYAMEAAIRRVLEG